MTDAEAMALPTIEIDPKTGLVKKKVGGQPGNAGGRKLGETVASGKIQVPPKARERAALKAAWVEAMSRQLDPIIQAQISSAVGVQHMQARDEAGKWTTVTDPAVMAAKLEQGEDAYRLSAIAPSVPAIKDILDRLFGQAKQSVDLDVTNSPTADLSDGELSAQLTALLKKLND